MTLPPNALWDFAAGLYRKPPVTAACLALQERYAPRIDLDVNMVLWCVWAAATGRRALDAQTLAAATGMVAHWRRDVVLPLRGARRALRAGIAPVPEAITEPVRGEIAQIEVEAERIELMMLAEVMPAPHGEPGLGAADAAATNIHRYLSHLGIPPAAADDADLAVILGEAFAHQRSGKSH